MGSLYKAKTSKWFKYQWVDAAGRIRTRTLLGVRDLKTAKEIAAKIQDKNAMEVHGLVDPVAKKLQQEGTRPIGEHIEFWRQQLKAGGHCRLYCAEEPNLVARVMEAAAVRNLSQIAPGPIKVAIGNLTRKRATASAEKSLSNRRKNAALTACKMFLNAMKRDGRVASNALEDLSGWEQETDHRHQHVAFSPEECAAVIAAAERDSDSVEGLTGQQRGMLYRLAAGTGFRRRTLRELTPRHLHLRSPVPFIRVLPTNVKNKKAKDQPITQELAERLKKYVKGLQPDQPLFPFNARADTSNMMRHDFANTGYAYKADGTHYRDFHSWRATYATELGRVASNIKVVQELMGHSTPVLTARYMRPTMDDYTRALNQATLPGAAKGEPEKDSEIS